MATKIHPNIAVRKKKKKKNIVTMVTMRIIRLRDSGVPLHLWILFSALLPGVLQLATALLLSNGCLTNVCLTWKLLKPSHPKKCILFWRVCQATEMTQPSLRAAARTGSDQAKRPGHFHASPARAVYWSLAKYPTMMIVCKKGCGTR